MILLLTLHALAAPLTEGDVLEHIDARIPEVAAARAMERKADAQALGARGAFDPTWSADVSTYEGYYASTRVDVDVSAQTVFGPEIAGQYRLGQGDFAVYDGKFETMERGEVGVSASVPLRDLGLSEYRAKALASDLYASAAAARADDVLRYARLSGSKAYWDWVFAGRSLEVERELLARAERRSAALEREVDTGARPEIDIADNARVLAKRRARVALAQADWVEAAQGLGLWYRDVDGAPLLLEPDDLPELLPPELVSETVDVGLERALVSHPKLDALRAKLAATEVSQRRAARLRLPDVSLFGGVYQDVGAGPDRLAPPELRVGGSAEGTLLWRQARSSRLEAQADSEGAAAELRAFSDGVAADVRASYAQWGAAVDAWALTSEAYELALELLTLERRRQELGSSDLFRLVLREEALLDAGLDRAKAEAQAHKAHAEWRAATFRDGP